MVRHRLVIGFATVVGTARVTAQAPGSPGPGQFGGVWVMNPTQSQTSDPFLTALKLTVSTHADTLAIQSDGTDNRNGTNVGFTTRTQVALNGTPTESEVPAPINRLTAVVTWERDTMVIVLTGSANGNPVRITQRWSLDAAGLTLTRRQRLELGGREISEALVFARQQPSAPAFIGGRTRPSALSP